jgi:hypothetical protein
MKPKHPPGPAMTLGNIRELWLYPAIGTAIADFSIGSLC